MSEQPQQPPFDPSAPLAELVQRLAKGKSLAELVRAARYRRKRPDVAGTTTNVKEP